MKDLVMTILGIGLVGFLIWAVVTYIPMPDVFYSNHRNQRRRSNYFCANKISSIWFLV